MFVSNVGTWMQRVAQDWLVLVVLGGGGQAVGITTGLQFLPFLLVAPFGGLLADRLRKRSLLIFTNAFMGAVGLALGVLVLTGVAEVWHVYVLAFLLGVGAALDNPARQAFVSEVVSKDDLSNAIALNSASFNAARLIGPALAGLLIGLIGTGWVFIINGTSFLSPIIALSLLRTLPDLRGKKDEEPGTLTRLRAGFSYVRSRPDLVMIMAIMFGVGTFGLNFQMTMGLMATQIYDKGPHEYGILGSLMAIGTLTGALLAARRKVPRRRLIVGGAVLFGVLEALGGLMPSYPTFAIALIPIGVVAMTIMTAANAYVQTTVPQHMRGRVMSLYIMILMGGTPIGAPLLGWLADLFGARWSLLGGGFLTVVWTVGVLLVLAPRSGVVVRARFRPRPGLVITVKPPIDAGRSVPAAVAATAERPAELADSARMAKPARASTAEPPSEPVEADPGARAA